METYSIDNHQNKCRCCFKTLNKRQKHAQITEDIENKFYSITQIHLKSSPNYSNKICQKCDKELQSFEQFKKNLIERQLKLYEIFSDDTQKMELPAAIVVKPELLEIEIVQIKQEVKTENDEVTTVEGDKMISEDEEVSSPAPFQDDFDFKAPLPVKRKERKIAETKAVRYMKNSQQKVGLCPECGKYVSGVRRHFRRVHSKILNFFCDLCEYSCLEKPQFLTHMKNKHRPKELREKYKCRHCDFTSVDRGYLRGVHEKIHSGLNFDCHCGKSFATKHILAQHVSVVHEREVKHKCQFCPKGYYHLAKLREHLLTQHTKKDVRDKICEICSKPFVTKLQLSAHVKEVHTEGTITCKFPGCTKKFHKISKRERHMRVHTKEKKFSCDKCGSSYGYSSQLYRHEETVHQGLRFYCEVANCSASFCRRDNVRMHFGKTHPNLSQSELETLLKQLKESKPR